MVRTQIQLTDEQTGLVKRIAAERHVSMAKVIREALDIASVWHQRAVDKDRIPPGYRMPRVVSDRTQRMAPRIMTGT